ncbi:MAG TPA: TetR/AcrR family transcriptional regulator [Streptosporangiaceae bacterium]|nr:TetR/AcrR family transcriptional regulator [Streptosporangiaceae bacterium]
MPRVKQRTQALRDHVLNVALATLAAEGVAGFTTRRVAEQAQTSTPAVYELFGDKAGLVREVFFEGFRLLRRRFGELDESADPRADLADVLRAFRLFVRDNPVLGQLMFSRPFADFDPGPAEQEAGASVREFIVGRVRRCTRAGLLRRAGAGGDADVDVAHVLLALAQGLAAQESAGWLGSTSESRDRRWELAVSAVLDGLG